MNTRFPRLCALYLKSGFSFRMPAKEDWKKPKTVLKTLGIAILAALIVADLGFVFVMMNVSLYNGLKPAGMQEFVLLNAATMSAVMVFIFSFLIALSMFSMSGIESGFMSMPFSAAEMLAAKMVSVYCSEAILSVFFMGVSMAVYAIYEHPPFMFYLNGLLSSIALPLVPVAVAYAILVPFMNASRYFRNKNFLLVTGGFLGIGASLAFNFYIQSVMMKVQNPANIALIASPSSFVSAFGKAWWPSWLAWKSLSASGSLAGFGAALANIALGLLACTLVALVFGKLYIRSLQTFNESTFSRKALTAVQKDRFFRGRPVLASLLMREIRLMNREPMYMLNGPFIILLLPVILAVTFIAQRQNFGNLASELLPRLPSHAGYLIAAAFGAFLGSSTSIACTAVSRDAKALPWLRSMPVSAKLYFGAKLLHAELFSVFGALVGCGSGIFLLRLGAGDSIAAILLALLFSSTLNLAGLWLDTANARLAWDNPIAALKQNPNAVFIILGSMGVIALCGVASAKMKLPHYGYGLVFGGIFLAAGILCGILFPKYAEKKLEYLEA